MQLASRGSFVGVLLAGVLSIGGCPGASSDDKTGESDPDKPSGKKSGKAEPTPEKLPTLVTDEVVRLEGGRALLRLPDELPSGWTIVHKHDARMNGLQLFRGTPKDFTAFVTLVFAPPARERTPEAFHAEHAKSLGRDSLVAKGPPAPFDIVGGLANEWAGTNQYGVDERAWVAVIVQDTEAVSVLARSSVQLYESEVLPLTKNLLAGLRLGSDVPKLADNKPSERLEGVWEYKHALEVEWMSFDPRGYAHMSSPGDPSDLDFDVRLALGQALYEYEIAGGKIVLEPFPPKPDGVNRNWSFSREGDVLQIEHEEYRRVDNVPVDLQPGRWEFYESFDTGNAYMGSTGIATDERTYVFAADGTYTYTGGFSYSHTQMDMGNPGDIDWSASGYAAPEPAKGKWKVDGNMLVLDDGKVVAKRLVYPSKHSPGKVVYIAGLMFLKKD